MMTRGRTWFDRLASPRLAAALIAIMLAGGLVSFVIPQSNKAQLTLYDDWKSNNPVLAQAAEATGFDDIFASPLMMAVFALLAVNLTACTIRRVRRRRGRATVVPRAPVTAQEVILPAGTRTEALSGHVPFGWRRLAADDGAGYVLDGGALGFAGSIIMHAGLILLLLGGLVSALTRFSGEIALTQGETVPDIPASYSSPPREPLVGNGYRDGTIGLDSLKFHYVEGKIGSVDAVLRFTDSAGSRAQDVRINEPASWLGKSFLLLNGGHAVALRVSDDSGAEVLNAVVRLGDQAQGGYEDEISLPDATTLKIRTVADARDLRRSAIEVMALRNPAVGIGLVGSASAETTIVPGASSAVGRYEVAVDEVLLWTTLLVRSDGGIPVAYTAFALVLLGMLMRLQYPSRLVAVRFDSEDDGVVKVRVWSRHETAAETKAVDRVCDDLIRHSGAELEEHA